jgi:hypothetical protein
MTTEFILKEVAEKGLITEKQISLLKLRSNKEQKNLYDLFDEEIQCTTEQTKKGLEWLLNKWKTPKGAERKNNPFGYREQNVLEDENAKAYFNGFYNAGRYNVFFIPIYEITGNGTSFEYIVEGGEIKIIG